MRPIGWTTVISNAGLWTLNAGRLALAVLLIIIVAGCQGAPSDDAVLASGYVEATEIRIASEVAGRVLTVEVSEGQRVKAGQTLVTLSTQDTDSALARLEAERAQAEAQWRLLNAGARVEDVRQAEAQVQAAKSDERTAGAELSAAQADAARFEQLLERRAGSAKQRDDAVARRDLAEARVRAAKDRVQVAEAQFARARAGARREELDAARARIGVVDVQIATLRKDLAEATIVAPADSLVSSRLVEPGELVAPRVPVLTLVDLDHAWANAYVEEPAVAALKIDQPATVITDGGGRLEGRVTFISPRAEFTPRNVQTANERAKLVYRVKVTVDNRGGVLKPGMPVEVAFGPRGGA